ncbi:hypothetical protein [Mycolicibacterium litorale]|uniref:Uncharacterized protein n=1 Tax=Mycolicibacterium litorale TaxID=758802 RepID=A0AAD1IR00_9MYCO|nr:hypothetical protein [Mycolicibacterium litorale]MCV7414970.1 hypothetical protein [Mycolicibacterium litorale]TDY08219.1 hypothetical protein BCL50_0282 [Mycolicibacterium litorale]BBY16143.1 hypothetical protein MLIT_17350 [Mycolicibacterium litorale]
MDIGKAAVTVAVAAVSVSGCGYRMGAYSDAGPTLHPTENRAVAASAAARPEPVVRHNASIAANHAVPPNADGDPACPPSQAWGRQPEGPGVLVTVWAEDSTAVTVLVRTDSGADIAERGMVDREDIRLFEFPKIDASEVREVLIMTNTQRCFAIADPMTFE